MQHHREIVAIVGENGQQVLVALTIVNHERFINPARQVRVPAQGLTLGVLVRTLVELAQPVIVEPGLPDRDTARILSHLFNAGTHAVCQLAGSRRVDGARCDNIGMEMGGLEGFLRFVQSVAYSAHPFHATAGGSGHQLRNPGCIMGSGGP